MAAAALVAMTAVALPAEAITPVTPKPPKKCKKAGKAKPGKKKCAAKKKRKTAGDAPAGPLVTTTLSLTSYESGVVSDQVRGTIVSADPACASDARVVGLFEGDPPFGTPIDQAFPVAGTLTFTIPAQAAGDRFYARTDGGLVGAANCDAAASNPISKP